MNTPLSLLYTNVSRARISAGDVSTASLHEELSTIAKERSGSYASRNDVIRLPLDPHVLVECKRVAEAYYTSQLKYVIVVGIGGSNLGAKAIYEALRGTLDLGTSRFPKMLFLDTVSGMLMHDMLEILSTVTSKEEILINLISKSGTTSESIVNFEILIEALQKRFDGVGERVVCTTDYESPLWHIAERRGYGLLAIPKLVGGRYSVFSPVGIFPLLVVGIDVVSLQNGAKDMLARSFAHDLDQHYPRHSAEILFGEMQNGVSILNIFHFHPELESLGKWERQLIAESLGKEKDISGRDVRAGITPIVSIGSTDLHSMAQLYFGGPKDKFTMLISSPDAYTKKVAPKTALSELSLGFAGKTEGDVMEAILAGVASAYKKHQLPLLEVRIPTISPFTIGAYLQWRMMTTIYLASLMHVNPFDQPNVEDYKLETRRLLGGSAH